MKNIVNTTNYIPKRSARILDKKRELLIASIPNRAIRILSLYICNRHNCSLTPTYSLFSTRSPQNLDALEAIVDECYLHYEISVPKNTTIVALNKDDNFILDYSYNNSLFIECSHPGYISYVLSYDEIS